jgi:osmoprotectant transport system ATP-binding protein
MTTAIEYRHVGKSYGDRIALKDLTLKIDQGEFVTVVGSSGGGKTTALKMVNGLIQPTSGEILVNGQRIKDQDRIQLRRSIGYAIQGSVLFPNMTVEENIAYVPSLWNKKDKAKTAKAVDKWMKITGLDASLKDCYPDELSGGQAQRVGIARALAASPDILLMDEPFGAVDAITREQLQAEIKRIQQETGVTILFVTHDIEEALKLGTKVLVIDGGEVQQYDAPSEILMHPATAFVEKLVERERKLIAEFR